MSFLFLPLPSPMRGAQSVLPRRKVLDQILFFFFFSLSRLIHLRLALCKGRGGPLSAERRIDLGSSPGFPPSIPVGHRPDNAFFSPSGLSGEFRRGSPRFPFSDM